MTREPEITQALLHGLLAEQHPDLAELPLGEIVQGWDNTMVRLGDRLALRLPRHEMGDLLLGHELRWLPALGRQTGVPVPAAVRTGSPAAGTGTGEDYPFRWAVVPWTPGASAGGLGPAERDSYAEQLARTLAALHVSGPVGAPTSPVGRGQALGTVLGRMRERLGERASSLGEGRVRRLEDLIEAAVTAPAHTGPALWLHGDPHPRNTVVASGAEADQAGMPLLVDFGDLCVGDPASDLGQTWDHFTAPGREQFRQVYGNARGREPADEEPLWTRARGWAVHYALIYLDPQRPAELHRAGERMVEDLCMTRL